MTTEAGGGGGGAGKREGGKEKKKRKEKEKRRSNSLSRPLWVVRRKGCRGTTGGTILVISFTGILLTSGRCGSRDLKLTCA